MIKQLFVKIFRRIKRWDELMRQAALREKYGIHKSFRFNGDNILFYGDGKLSIGENSYIGSNSTIQIDSYHKVSIGKGCQISHNVRMYTTSMSPDQDFSIKDNRMAKKGDIIIGDYVWLGANVFINPGVIIGENTVVGANSVVTKNLEAFSVYGGVPAKLIRRKTLDV